MPGTPTGWRPCIRIGRLPWSEIVVPARELAAAGPRSRCSTRNCCPRWPPRWCSATASRCIRGPTATVVGGRCRREMLHHEGLADTLDDYLIGPDALTTGRAGTRRRWPRSPPTAARCPMHDMAQYRVEELPVRKVRFGPGVICVRGNDLDAFGRHRAGAEPAPARQRSGRPGRSLVRSLRAPARACRDDHGGRRRRAGQRLCGHAFAGPRIGHLDRRGARQLDARRGRTAPRRAATRRSGCRR